MTQKKLRKHLVDYYSGESLPEEQIARLSSLASDPVEHAAFSRARGRGNRFGNILYGLAACGAVALIGINSLSDSDRLVDSEPPARVSSPTSRPALPPARTGSIPPDAFPASMHPSTPDPIPAPALVAARVHSDWCPRCPIVGPIFDRLAETYGDQPILFVTLDVTDQTKRRQAHYMASSLGIDWATNASFKTGMIKLIDRERREVLATVTSEEHVPLLERALAVALQREQ